MTLAELNALSADAFCERLGGIAEHSPWVAASAAGRRPFSSAEDLVAAFQEAIAHAGRARQLDLLNAHPDLAGRAALAPASAREQAGAGLDTLTEEEFGRFHALNAAYRGRFGFPFILAVKGAGKQEILQAFGQRAAAGVEEEFWMAIAQVMRIVRFRLEDLLRG
jgi:OHCU decarboxylase